MDEGVAGAGVGGQLAGAGQLQALDDRLRESKRTQAMNVPAGAYARHIVEYTTRMQ